MFFPVYLKIVEYFVCLIIIIYIYNFLWRSVKMKILYYIALTLVIVGALNWLLIGLLKFDLVAALFGTMSLLSRIVYSLLCLSGIISIGLYSKIND